MLLQDKAYVLFARAQGETSLWLSLLTEYHGRLQLTFKGGQKKSASLPPFTSLELAWRQGRESGGWLSQCEAVSFQPPLQGMANWSGLYANELLHRSLLAEQPMPLLFHAYEQLVVLLRASGSERAQMAWALRRFEWVFIAEMGYGLPELTHDGAPLTAEVYYQWHADGWQPSETGILGEELVALIGQATQGKTSRALRELLQWRLLQAVPSQALSMRQWWEQLA